MSSRWRPIAAAMLAGGLIAIAVFAPRATAATPALDEPASPRTHQLTVCKPGEPCESRGRPRGATACGVDAASERLARELPDATRIECRPVPR